MSKSVLGIKSGDIDSENICMVDILALIYFHFKVSPTGKKKKKILVEMHSCLWESRN